MLLEVALHQPDRLGGDALAVQVLYGLDLGIVRYREHPAHRIGGRFRIVEFADLVNVAAVFVYPVVTADSGVEKPEFDITAHLLRTQKTALDFLIIDRRNVAAARTRHVEPCALEQREGRFLQTALRQT